MLVELVVSFSDSCDGSVSNKGNQQCVCKPWSVVQTTLSVYRRVEEETDEQFGRSISHVFQPLCECFRYKLKAYKCSIQVVAKMFGILGSF